MSFSSRPRWPPSPACGLSPSTAMRGRAMPNLAIMSPCTMRSVRSSDGVVIAAGTAASGRWVVASATRNSGLASIITTSACVRSAKNSVWPRKAMPASLIEDFCSGAVTSAS